MRKIVLVLFLLLVTGIGTVPAQEDDGANVAYQTELIIERPFVTSIIWGPDGNIYWTEKDGLVQMMTPDGVPAEEPVLQLTVANTNEQGLMSMVFNPNFEENPYFYVYYTRPPDVGGSNELNVLERYTLADGKGIDRVEMLRIEIPNNEQYRHNGGRLKFGPNDGFLYVPIGDLGSANSGQNFQSMLGKIHRFAVLDTQIVPAPGNPFPGNSIWATGVRNTFGMAFDMQTGYLFGTENGPTCDDEINLIIAGQNYGWSGDISCDDPPAMRQSGGLPPLISWTPTISPTGIIIYDGAAFPEWQGDLFYCTFNNIKMYRVLLNDHRTRFASDPMEVPAPTKEQSCSIEIAQSPEGYIYYSTVGAIYRMIPPPPGG